MPSKKEPVYKRILLKLSGEAFLGDKEFGIDQKATSSIAQEIISIQRLGIDVCVVIGAGNLFRGSEEVGQNGLDHATTDYMGILATIINGMALQAMIESKGVPTRLMTSLEIKAVAEPYIRRRAIHHLEKGRIVIFGGGTGSPFFTTDTAAALRALEVNCEVLLKGTKVDGVYNKDPQKFSDARKYKKLSFLEALGQKEVKVIDKAALSLCLEHNIPVIVYNFFKQGNTKKIVLGEELGTLITN